MPMSTKVDRFFWDSDDVADAPFDVSVTAGAQVELDRLVRLHETGLGVCPKIDGDAFGHTHTVCPVAVRPASLTSTGSHMV